MLIHSILFVRYGVIVVILFFFFKQKTAFDVRLSLGGSEMFIRDRGGGRGMGAGLWPWLGL